MDRGYEKDGFATVKIKNTIAKKFRNYSRAIGKSQSVTLLLMVEFFENNQIAPTESLGPSGRTIEASLKKRINALIAIIKDIEKKQTKPTISILNALLEQPEPKKEPRYVEKKQFTDKDNYWK